MERVSDYMDEDIENYYVLKYMDTDIYTDGVRMERVQNDMDEDIENYYIWIYMAKSTDGKG